MILNYKQTYTTMQGITANNNAMRKNVGREESEEVYFKCVFESVECRRAADG